MARGGGIVSKEPHATLPEPARIRRLPEDLIDQIAAGEVVERPASVVKELVENSVDAGARRIRVEVREGGRSFLAVTDDGSGMGPADARLALERHATSKLASAADLARIASFGFRGEALPAIASVSRFRLRTRAAADAEGTELCVDHGRGLEVRAAGSPLGTRIEVADLFAALPARRKFLKAASTEWTHVADWLARAALALPAVHFDVQRDDRAAWSWPATGDRLARIAAVLSEREAEALLPAELEREGLRLRAFVSRPDVHRRSAEGLYLYVNGRPVRDRLLRHALLEAYRDWLPRGRFPTALLELELPADAVDVNVHPAKWEVRFADPQRVHGLVSATVRRAIESRGWLAQPSVGEASVAREGAGRAASCAKPAPRSRRPPRRRGRAGRTGSSRRRPQPAHPRRPPPAPRPGPASRICAASGSSSAPIWCSRTRGPAARRPARGPRARPLRAHAPRLAGGRGRAPGAPRARPPSSSTRQRGPPSRRRARRWRGSASRSRASAPGAVLVRAVPALLAERDPAALVRGLAEELRSGALEGGARAVPGAAASVRLLEAADRLFASLACHAARRAGDVLAPGEQRALLDALDAIPWAPTCPHGRPVAVPRLAGGDRAALRQELSAGARLRGGSAAPASLSGPCPPKPPRALPAIVVVAGPDGRRARATSPCGSRCASAARS